MSLLLDVIEVVFPWGVAVAIKGLDVGVVRQLLKEFVCAQIFNQGVPQFGIADLKPARLGHRAKVQLDAGDVPVRIALVFHPGANVAGQMLFCCDGACLDGHGGLPLGHHGGSVICSTWGSGAWRLRLRGTVAAVVTGANIHHFGVEHKKKTPMWCGFCFVLVD